MSDTTHAALSAEPSRQVLEEAAVWYAHLHDDHVDVRTQQQWQDWYNQDVSHQLAWQRVEAISQKFGHIAQTPSAKALHSVSQGRRKSLKILSVALIGLGGAAAVSRTDIVQDAMQNWSASFSTGVGKTLRIALAGDSVLWLNTNSAVQVDNHSDIRQISLLRGEIYASLAVPDFSDQRPFTVQTTQGMMKASGDFSARSMPARTEVAVFNGGAQLLPETEIIPAFTLRSGQASYFTEDGVGDIHPVQGYQQSWTQGLLIADDMPLSSFINELSRYFSGHLDCDERVSSLRIVGTFPLNNISAIFAALENTLPVRVKQVTSWWVSVVPLQTI